eukprot:gene36849-45460_t
MTEIRNVAADASRLRLRVLVVAAVVFLAFGLIVAGAVFALRAGILAAECLPLLAGDESGLQIFDQNLILKIETHQILSRQSMTKESGVTRVCLARRVAAGDAAQGKEQEHAERRVHQRVSAEGIAEVGAERVVQLQSRRQVEAVQQAHGAGSQAHGDAGGGQRDAYQRAVKQAEAGGPAGAAAAVYAARKGIRTGVAAERFGGQVNDTLGIENYISVLETDGPKFAAALEAQTRAYGVDIMNLQRADKIIPAAQPGGLIEVHEHQMVRNVFHLDDRAL